MKIALLFNCQHDGIVRALRLLRPEDEIVSFEMGPVRRSSMVRERAMAAFTASDLVVSMPAGELFESLANDALRPLVRRLVVMPPISFAGFHPDTIYIRDPGARCLQGPTGPYHSRIAAAAYVAGLEAEAALALFNRLVCARLGYLGAYERESRLIREQFARFGIELAPWLARWDARRPFMHSLNHPKIFVLADLARIILGRIGIEPQADEAALERLPDLLAGHPSHPVPSPIAEDLGIASSASFKPPPVDRKPAAPLGLEAFLVASFAAFREVDRDWLTEAKGVAEAVRTLGLNA